MKILVTGGIGYIGRDSREQFERRTHKRLIDIVSTTPKTMDALVHLEIPAGVDIVLK